MFQDNFTWSSKLLFALILLISLSVIQSKTIPRDCLNDKHRPQLHFSPREFWSNDPNGLVYYDGEYHMFYQYTPNSTQSGIKYWAHSVSTDLFTWTDLPIALYPDEFGAMWSGSAVVDYTNSSGFQVDPNVHPIVATFTHADGPVPQQQSIAYSLDKARTFTKYQGNPVIPNIGKGDFRDPKVSRFNNETWALVVAAGDRAQFYNSADLKKWELKSEFGQDPPQGSHGGTWECPDLLRFVNQDGYESWVLLISNFGGPNGGSGTQYFVGSFDGQRFHSDQEGVLWLEKGWDNYAGVTFSNEPMNRNILIGWMANLNYAGAVPTEKFKGQMTMPRVLTLVSVTGHLRIKSELPKEFEGLRNPLQHHDIPGQEIPRNEVLYVNEEMSFSNQLYEVLLEFDIAEIKGPSSIAICFLNSLEQELCVGYDHERAAGEEIFLNREKTGDLGAISGSFAGRGVAGRETSSQHISFRIILDVSAVELYVDGGLTVMTALFYPDEPLTTIEIRHHAFDDESEVTLLNGTVIGLNSMYDC